MKTFEEKYKAFKEGKTEKAPIIFKNFQIRWLKAQATGSEPMMDPEDMPMANDTPMTVCISREESDRDGETVMMDGCILRSWIVENGLPMIDSHDSFSTITTNGLGAMRNVRIQDVNGKRGLVAEPDFAPTPSGDIAKILYMGVNGGKPYFSNVSMGFAVYDYDNETRQILEWEPFECSLVTVGANMSARFMAKDNEVTEEKIAKDLARFKQIHEPFKEFCKLFLDDKFFEKFGIKKNGDLILDINSLYDVINKRFYTVKEAPTTVKQKEAPIESKASTEEINSAIVDEISKQLEKYLI